MKNVLIIGATGSLARVVIENLAEDSTVNLTLFLRSAEKLGNKAPAKARIIESDVMNYNGLREAIAGQDIVYVNLAGNLDAFAKNIVHAMQETGVKRIIAISSIGIYDKPLKPVLVPYRKLADVVEASGLNYTILRPDWFTDVDEVDYSLTHKAEPEKGRAVSRKSIAAFIAKLVANPELHKNENLGISKPA